MQPGPWARTAAPACSWRTVAGFPDLARLHRLTPSRYPHLLESVAHGTPQARYDVLFAFPGDSLVLESNGTLLRNGMPIAGDFLDTFEASWRLVSVAEHTALPFPFHGGWFMYLSYELARFLEPSLASMPPGNDWPVAVATRFPAAVIRDHETRTTVLVSEHPNDDLLNQMEQDLRRIDAVADKPGIPVSAAEIEEEDPALHRQRIARILDYIRAGDTYQVNLSRSWRLQLKQRAAAVDLYEQLRRANPAPFAGLMTIDANRAVISSSPERLVSVRHGHICTRPIAGTHPRSANTEEDQALAQTLVRNPKERAEHVMLVDLERNDLGRICRPGSVRTDESLVVESYRHVHHIVSNICGELNAGVTPAQVIRAVFPGGTITGCPKLRTMQIIAELEGAARGAYTGSMGYINRDGGLDLNILIRTLTLDGKSVQLRAGGGIVADSDPDRELNETRAKAKGMLAALAMAGTVS
ncbi:MAG TPA: aminodeoxychorismate synthase component I [Acidiferrobacterales bacterium]|nr:aminodeoxychorismate synthase component I [Acidiferrobacterales bacterium]